jgi:hypothetical protein
VAASNFPPDGLPEPLERLLRTLEDRKFQVDVERFDRASFGNAMLEAGDGRVSVRMIRERGDWNLDARSAGWGEWFPVSAWRALFEDSAGPVEPMASTEQAEYLLEHLDRVVEVAARGDAADLERLRRWRDERSASWRRSLFRGLGS